MGGSGVHGLAELEEGRREGMARKSHSVTGSGKYGKGEGEKKSGKVVKWLRIGLKGLEKRTGVGESYRYKALWHYGT